MGGIRERMLRPSPPGQRKLVDLPAVVEAFTGGDAADDLDGLAGAPDGTVEAHAVPALHDLRSAGADTEDESTTGQRLERLGRHRQHGGGACAELHDPRGQSDRGGLPGEVGERGEGVAGPELRHPDRVHPEPVGLADELDAGGVRGRRRDADAQGHRVASASCLTPATVACMLAWTSSRRRRRTRGSLPGWLAMAIEVPDGPGPMV